MKRFLFSLIGLSFLLHLSAQEAIYIYRNDGLFNAFYQNEVDSITVSRYDEAGNESQNFQSQIIWTQDSVYYIPLAAIDSVSLCKPEKKYAQKVRLIDNLMPYITEVDGMRLKLSSDTPLGIIPRKGDVLLYENYENELFPFGFAGRVEETGYTITCDSVALDDIYEQLICFGNYTLVNEKDRKGNTRQRLIRKNAKLHIPTSVHADLSLKYDSIASLSVHSQIGYDFKIVYKQMKGEPLYFEFSAISTVGVSFDAGVMGEFSGDVFDNEKMMKILTTPIPGTPLLFSIKGRPVLEWSFNGGFTFSVEAINEYEFGYKHCNGNGNWYCTDMSTNCSTPGLYGNLSGSIFAGILLDPSVDTPGSIFYVTPETKIGAEISGELKFNLSKKDDYSVLRNCMFNLDAKIDVVGKAGLDFFGLKHFEWGTPLMSLKVNVNSWKLVPDFSMPQIDMLSQTKATISVVPEGKLFPPGVDIGLGIMDNSERIDFHACTETYREINEWPLEKFQTTFEGLIPGHEYEVFPVIWWGGRDMKASPSTTFMTSTPTPAEITDFKVDNASFIRKGFEYKDKTYYYDFAATTTVELENNDDVVDWGYVYIDPYGEADTISVAGLGSNPAKDSRYHYYRSTPNATATLYGYSKYADGTFVFDEPKDYDLVYTFHPTAYVGNVITDSLTSTSAQFEYGFDDIPRTGKCFTAVQSARDDEPIVKEVSYAEKDTVKFADLFPGTTYKYWAYVEYAGMTYASDKKSLTTLTPIAHVEKADDDKVTMTSAEIGYGFANVPENAKCYVGISAKVQTVAGDGEEINKSYSQTFSVENTTGATYEFNGLYPSTTYTYYAYVEYEGETWFSDGEKFTTKAPPTPVATTGDCSAVTTNSSTMSCSFENVPEGGICGVEYTWSNGSQKQSIGNVNGTQTITISGLESGTTYSYRAYVKAYGQTYYGEEKTFTTKYEIPDITGVWHCTEYQEGVEKGKATFELKAGGTVNRSDTSGTGGDCSSPGRWSINADGYVRINFEYVSNSGASEKTYGGTIDSFVNPTRVEGKATYSYTGNMGGGTRRTYDFIMTR